jgi:SAM-dependent methyltransferase
VEEMIDSFVTHPTIILMNELIVKFPDPQGQLDQDEEYFILNGDEEEKIMFHEYDRIFKVPGLYEKLFHEKLKCKSPSVMRNLLHDQIENGDVRKEDLNILDFGAGNGLVAEELNKEHPNLIVGIDILEEAKEAALRDRSEVYKDYLVTDLAKADDQTIEKLEDYNFNAMVSVAAFGFDHIPPEGFIKAINLVRNNGLVAFNLRDRFLTAEDDSGFKETLEWIEGDKIEVLTEKTYVHRYNTGGEPIHYTAIIGKKLSDI